MTCVNRITLRIYRFLPAVLQVNTWKAIFSQFLGNLYQNYITSTYIVGITKLLQTQNDFTRPLSAGGCTTTVTLVELVLERFSQIDQVHPVVELSP